MKIVIKKKISFTKILKNVIQNRDLFLTVTRFTYKTYFVCTFIRSNVTN